MVTIKELARRSGRHRSSLARIAGQLGFPLTGRDYLLTSEQARELLATARKTAGNPNFGKNFRVVKAKRAKTSKKRRK